MKLIIQLIYSFFTTGLFAVGGGLATIPFLQQMGENYGWFDSQTLSMMIAVSESTPGPMGINMATYVGYNVLGITGGVLATLSIVTPSIIVITIIFKFLDKFRKNIYVTYIFDGIKPAVVAFIICAVLDLFVATLFKINNSLGLNFKSCLFFLILLFVYTKYKKKISPIMIIVSSAIFGILLL